eukprot:113564-Chlamydomonas_euryale.AAC.1
MSTLCTAPHCVVAVSQAPHLHTFTSPSTVCARRHERAAKVRHAAGSCIGIRAGGINGAKRAVRHDVVQPSGAGAADGVQCSAQCVEVWGWGGSA